MSSAADLAHLIKILEAALKVRGEEEPISSAQRDPESDANNVGSIEGPSLSGSSTSAPPQNAAVEEDPLVTAHRLLMTVARRRGIALPPFADVGSSPCASTSVGMENATAGQETSKTCRAGSSNNKNGRGTPPPPSSGCPYVLAPPSSLSRAPASLLASTSTTSSSSTRGVGSATAGLVHCVSHQPAATAGGGLGLPAGAGRSAVVSARTSPRLVARDAVIMTAMCPCDEPSTSDGGGERRKQCQVTNECGTQTAVDGALGVVHAEEQVIELKQRGAHVPPPLVPSRQGHGEEAGRIDALNACTEAVPVTNTGGARGSRPSSAQKKSNTHGYGSGGNGVKPIDEGSDGGVGIERGEGKAPTLAPKKVPSWTMGVSVSALSSPISRGPQAPAAKGRALSRDEKAGVSAFPAGIPSAEDNGVGFSAEGGPHPQSDLEISRCSTSSATFMPPHDDSFEATSYGYSYRGEDANGEHDNENKEIEEEEGCVHHHGLDQRGRGASLSSPEAAVAVVNTMSHKKHYYDQQVQRLQQAEAARAEEDGGTQWPSSYTSTKEEGEGKRSSIHRAGSIISIVADPLDNSVIVAGESSFFSTERPVKLKDLKKLFPPPELYYSLVPPAPKKEPTHRQSNAKAETNVTSRPLSASSPSHSSSPKGKRSRRSKKRHGAQEDEEENIHYDGINESRAGMTTAAAAAEDNTISTGRGPSLPSSPLSKNKKAFASFHHPKDESNVKPPRAEDSFSSGASSPTEGRSKPASPTEARSSRNNHITAGKKTKATESTSGDALVSREPDEASLSPSMSSPPSTPSNKAKKVFPRSGDKKEGSTHKSANPHKSTISTAEAVVSGQGNYGTVCKGYRIQNTTHVNTVQELPYLSSSSSLTSSASASNAAVVALKISKIKDKWSLDEVEALRHCSFVARRVLTTAGLAAAAACVPLSADFNSLKGVIGEASSPSAASSPQRPHSAGGGPSSSSRPASAKSLAALDPHLVAGALRVITLQGQVCYDPRRHCLWIPLPWIPTTLEGLIKFRVEWRKRSQNFSETASASASSPSAAGVGAGVRVGARPAQRLLPPAPLFTLKEIQCVFRQLLQAVYFFSSAARVVHLDIKPANVLIRDGDVDGDQSSNQGNRNMAQSYELLRFEELPTYPTTEANDGEKPSRPYPLPPPTSMNSSTTNIATTAAAASIVLCDYGLMQHSGGELVQLGDYLYMSPEVYFCDVTATTTTTSSEEGGEEDVSSAEDNSNGSDGQEEEEEGTKKSRPLQVFSEQNDVWSVGCVVLEMLDGLPAMAWEANDAFAALKENYLAPAPRHVSQWPGDLVHCVSLCFERDPRVRLSARELLDHPFFRNSFGEGVH